MISPSMKMNLIGVKYETSNHGGGLSKIMRTFPRSCSLENAINGSQCAATVDVISPQMEDEEQLVTEEDSIHSC